MTNNIFYKTSALFGCPLFFCSYVISSKWIHMMHLPFSIHQHRGNPLLWRHNEVDGVPNHQPHNCLLNRLFRRRLKKTSKLRLTGLCEGNSPVTGEFPSQRASNEENASIWWRHHTCDHPSVSERKVLMDMSITVQYLTKTIHNKMWTRFIFFYMSHTILHLYDNEFE